MTLTVTALQPPLGDRYFSSPGVRQMVEDHISYLQNPSNHKLLQIEPTDTVKYLGDFYGLLISLGIEHDLHWICLRMNGYTATDDYNGSLDLIRVPIRTIIKNLVVRHITTSNIS